MKIALVMLLSIVLAQLIKWLGEGFSGRFSWKSLVRDGGFPSGHSALVTALTVSVYYEQGFSVLFFVCLGFSGLVINDAYRSRREIGQEAKALNIIIVKEKVRFPKLFEGEGHTIGQVFAGIALGVFITMVVYGV